jgi:hypothetical protein
MAPDGCVATRSATSAKRIVLVLMPKSNRLYTKS